MGNALRNSDPELFRLITIRTEGSRLWMLPVRKIEKLLGGIIARYQELLSIEIFAYIFLSNHYHLLIRAPKSNADEFCENLNREIARRLNWKFRREGKFWGRRYADQAILSEEDLIAVFLYITTNPVRHGLVSHPREWSGLSSYVQSLNGGKRTFTFYHYSALGDAPQNTQHSLTLSPLPQLASLSQKERKERLNSLIEERCSEILAGRRASGQGVLGIEQVLLQEPGITPLQTSRSVRPLGYSKSPSLIRVYRALCRQRRAAYDEASRRYRLGDYSYPFPIHSFRPPTHRMPRAIPFQPLDKGAFQNVA